MTIPFWLVAVGVLAMAVGLLSHAGDVDGPEGCLRMIFCVVAALGLVLWLGYQLAIR